MVLRNQGLSDSRHAAGLSASVVVRSLSVFFTRLVGRSGMQGRYIANTRMYDVCPVVAARWRELVQTVASRAGVCLHHEAHAFPADIEALWQRPDLGLVFMCGRPFRLAGGRHKPVAAPVLCNPPARGANPPAGSLYATVFLVRDNSPWARLEDSFGSRMGWTVTHSHSGYNAVRRALLPHAGGAPLYQTFVGPLHTPGRCLEALKQGEVDVAPLDGYCHDLLSRHAPERLAGTRVLAVSPPAPMPFLVASPETPDAVCAALREALIGLDDAALLADLALTGFRAVQADDYLVLDVWDREATVAGLDWCCTESFEPSVPSVQ